MAVRLYERTHLTELMKAGRLAESPILEHAYMLAEHLWSENPPFDGDSVTTGLGDHSVLVMSVEQCVGVVITLKAHPVKKSVSRMLRRLLKSAMENCQVWPPLAVEGAVGG